MKIHAIASGEREDVAAVWRSLESRVGQVPLTASWEWTQTWLRHYGGTVPHRFLVGQANGSPCGAALLCEETRRRGPFKVRRMHLGTGAEPEGERIGGVPNAVLADPATGAEFAAGLVGSLAADRSWDELRLDAFPEERARPFLDGDDRLSARTEPSPRLDLTGATADPDSVLAMLRSRTRKRIRRSLRALEPLSTEWAEDPEQALEIFAELCDLHQARWVGRGEAGAFASPRVREFHRDLIRENSGSAVLYRVRSHGRTVACLYNLIDCGAALSYQLGIAPDAENRTSPGLVAHVLCMAASAQRGIRNYDFLAGEAQYKRQLSAEEGTLVWARRQRARARILKPRWHHGA